MRLSSIEVIPVIGPKLTRQFLAMPDIIYSNDPAWRPQLKFERAAHLNPKKNPGAASIENRQLFLAQKNGEFVGRIAAFINPAHNAHYSTQAGFFGFFDCEANPQTGEALLKVAENWIKEREASSMIGPAHWSVNEECGLLINGFSTPPVVMMPHGRADYQDMIEARGFDKATDMLAYQADLYAGYPRPKIAQVMVKSADRNKDLRIRPMGPHFMNEVRIVMDIFNDAWSENCLLYTSPSPRDKRQSRMPSSA